MIRPECYQCAACGRRWSAFFPRCVCPCGCTVLRTWDPRRDDPTPYRACLAEHELQLQVARSWSPYPLGNGTEGVINA